MEVCCALGVFNPENNQLRQKQTTKDEQTLLQQGVLAQALMQLETQIDDQRIGQGVLAQHSAGQHVGKQTYDPAIENAHPFGHGKTPVN